MLPNEFDPDRRCVTPLFSDPRTERGELLCPDLLPASEVPKLRIRLGDSDYDAQYQHNPHPEGGSRFQSQYFQYWRWEGTHQIRLVRRNGQEDCFRVDLLPKFVTVDPACSEDRAADYCSIGLWAQTPSNEMVLLRRKKFQGDEAAVIAAIRLLGYNVPEFGRIPMMWAGVEANGVGKPIAQAAAKENLPVLEIHIHSDKMVMSASASVNIQNGRIFFPDHGTGEEWLDEFLYELTRFPGAPHDDDVSMVSLAANSVYEGRLPILGGERSPKVETTKHDARKVQFSSPRRTMFGVNGK